MKHPSAPLRLCLLAALALDACTAQPTPARVEPLRFEAEAQGSSVPVGEVETIVETQPTPARLETPPAPATSFPTTSAGQAPTPSPVPQPTLRQLTSGQCCPNPFWSADGLQVQFVDRPASRPVGIYGVNARLPSAPTLVSRWVVETTGSGEFYVYPEGKATILQRVATGEQYAIANGGRPVRVSPDGQLALWQIIGQSGDFDKRRNQTWVANVDGSQARVVAETVGLADSQWVDARRVLLVGLPLADQPYLSSIAVLTLENTDRLNGRIEDQLLQIAHVSRPRGLLLSPQGQWLAYFLSFQSDPAQNGLWVVPTDGRLPPRKLNVFGSYRWRDDAHLLYVPLELDTPSHTLWEYDVISGEHHRLTDPEHTSFKIANNDWAVSPDGRYVVFLRARDHNLWLINLEPG